MRSYSMSTVYLQYEKLTAFTLSLETEYALKLQQMLDLTDSFKKYQQKWSQT